MFNKMSYKIQITVWLSCFLSFTANASLVDQSFNPGTGAGGGLVESVVPLSNGKILACGNFTSFNGSDRQYVVQLNADGSVDQSFRASPGYWVRDLAVQADGKIVIAGFFNNVEGQDRHRIARLNPDGSLDSTFQVGTGAQDKITQVAADPLEPNIFQLAIQPDGKILMVGNFATYNGVPRSGIARLNTDGSLDTTFNPGAGFNSWGRSIHVLSDGRIIATGWFTSYDNHPFNRMVVLSSTGVPDLTFNPYFGDSTSIYDMQPLSDGKMIVVGHSVNTEGLFRREVARINPDGSYDESFVGTTNEKTETVRIQPDGKIIMGGYFSLADGVQRNGIARFNPDGTLDPNFSATFDNYIWTVAFDRDGKVLASGGFNTVDGIPRSGIVRLTTGVSTPPNVLPAVSVTAPANNTTLTAPASFTVTANASDSDGQVTRVLFYNGLNLIGEDTDAPFSASVQNLAAGTYSITARAIDNVGGVTISVPIQLTVQGAANQSPSVSIQSPANNATLNAPATFNVIANASDPDGQIVRVSFYNGSNLIGESTSAPYTVSVANLTTGTYQISARALDNGGAQAISAPIQINVVQGVNQAPTISIQAPVNNSTFTGPRNLVITVNANDSDGSVTRVDFFNGRVYLGQSTTPPFTFTVPNAALGSYTLLARATDNSGATTLSAGSHVTLQAGTVASPALIKATAASNGTVSFSVQTEANHSYIVEATSNLQTPSWASVATFAGTGSDVPISHPVEQPVTFFRVRTE
ncbi:MAG: large protein [Verrucomicrobiales bacterium]|nr:large protein [Verrucomicrobiales bacterium]